MHAQSIQKFPYRCVMMKGEEPIATGWVSVSKGDDDDPEMRCRFVGKGFHHKKGLELFAATPPPEANKMLY